jgi:hypothetical protein
MKATITNTSRASQGVHSVDGLVFIDAGKSRDVDVADDYVERVKSLPFFASKWHGAAAEKPASGVSAKSKGKAPAKAKSQPARSARKAPAKATEPKTFDDMSDTELKTFLGTKGVTVTDETRDQLIELAKAA